MRNLKFRAIKDDMSNSKFVYGNLIYDLENNPRIQTSNGGRLFTTCIKNTEGQFTGITDKNGKEVFEGDIHSEKVKVDGKEIDCYLPIVWDNGAFWIDESFGKDATYLTLLCEYDVPLNIVGNRFENPELLK